LPGSVALEKNNYNISIKMISGGVGIVGVLNDILCQAYDGENVEQCSKVENFVHIY
jgi:hypothetical protein